ncbi:hypothetical protein VNO80_20556 [Phaseolus coccineus]|uniref:Uncharacterized protein n=1 Tax=Phaseolus coccineus TaxID=3886 RepID=A0AAN9M698_PHACN
MCDKDRSSSFWQLSKATTSTLPRVFIFLISYITLAVQYPMPMGPARMSFVLLWQTMWAWFRVRVKECLYLERVLLTAHITYTTKLRMVGAALLLLCDDDDDVVVDDVLCCVVVLSCPLHCIDCVGEPNLWEELRRKMVLCFGICSSL